MGCSVELVTILLYEDVCGNADSEADVPLVLGTVLLSKEYCGSWASCPVNDG